MTLGRDELHFDGLLQLRKEFTGDLLTFTSGRLYNTRTRCGL